MHLDSLSRPQFILLVMLVSFITSLATTIAAVTLLTNDIQPQTYSQGVSVGSIDEIENYM